MQGKKIRMEESKEIIFVFWNILDRSSVFSKHHHLYLMFCPYVFELWLFKKLLININCAPVEICEIARENIN